MGRRGECRWDYGQVMPEAAKEVVAKEAYLLWCGAGKPHCEDGRFWEAALVRKVRAECRIREVFTVPPR